MNRRKFIQSALKVAAIAAIPIPPLKRAIERKMYHPRDFTITIGGHDIRGIEDCTTGRVYFDLSQDQSGKMLKRMRDGEILTLAEITGGGKVTIERS